MTQRKKLREADMKRLLWYEHIFGNHGHGCYQCTVQKPVPLLERECISAHCVDNVLINKG